jgi:hypothetical protein
MSKRASLTNLTDRLARKAEPAPAAADAAAVAEPVGRSKRQPDGRRGILVRATPEAWRSLKLIAIDKEETLQSVMTQAINDFLVKNGKPPVA